MHQPEQADHFRKAIGSVSLIRIVDDVVREVDNLVRELFADLDHLLIIVVVLSCVNLVSKLGPANLRLI